MMYWESYGGFVKRYVRERGVRFAMDYIHAEDKQTNYVDIGPVNKVYNMLCVYVFRANRNNRHPEFLRHAGRVRDYLWIAEDGMKMQGYNGSQTWDTSFAIQAVVESGLAGKFPNVVRGAWKFLERNQILSTSVSQNTDAYMYEIPERRNQYYRHVSLGGWPFSTSSHGWPISDCTAEGLKAVLAMRSLKCLDNNTKSKITRKRLGDAVNVLLTLQNSSGGWATYVKPFFSLSVL
jgi:squalene cyclase